MPDADTLKRPWMVAAWPGMGHVAVNAGVYLLAKMEMTLLAEFAADDLFDVDHVEVHEGILTLGRRPRNRFFAWKNPEGEHDLVVFLGEAQPPIGRYVFCRKLIEYARRIGVERVYTFAAMGTQMRPEHESRVFVTATGPELLHELEALGMEPLANGQVSGLNGLLLGVARESEVPGACLLGEMPQVFSQLPFPKASLSILEVFSRMVGMELDLSQLRDQAAAMDAQLSDLLARVEETYGRPSEGEEEAVPEVAKENAPTVEQRQHIEHLFEAARRDRSQAFVLKQELDRLGVFPEYEDRFLDLFKK
jgi:proteasome assembly chaperone (PAC2) family protein